MWQISQNLFLGDRDDARDLQRLRSRGITHIVNCAEEIPCHYPGDFEYLYLRLADPDARFGGLIPSFCDFIDRAVGGGGRVLVHCSAGVSRSAAVVLAFLCHEGAPIDDAARRLRRAVLTNPDDFFLQQLGDHLKLRFTPADVARLSSVLLGRE